ncbi:sensor histidine kinase [Leisingera thetidis]|uniref:sensor histidine kinase n=1 Tax=Leisingera thetidis TaxID=2930199 RepID=UPI0021F6BC5C|nr:PAS domain-containing sensor histidine kinase [Leisingera thetidis]
MTLVRPIEAEPLSLWRSRLKSQAHYAAVPMAAAGFLFDYLTPLGVAAGIVYAAFFFCAVWSAKPNAAFIYAAIATALTLAGYALFHRIGVHEGVILANRLLAILALWIIAFTVHKLKGIQLSLEQKQSELAAIQDNTVDGLITIGTDGAIQSYNRACHRIFGYSPGEAIGRNIKFLMPEPYHSEHDGYIRAFLKTGHKNVIGVSREVRGRRKDGSTFPLSLSVSDVQVGPHRLFSGIVRDISDQKRTEAEREQFVKELARSNRDLDDFVYVASHDLRAPLRVIGNASRWLEEDLAGTLDDESRENLQLLRSRVSRMERLLDDLHEYSRAGRRTDSRDQEIMTGDVLMQEVLMLIDQPGGFTINIAPDFARIQLPNMPLKQIFANLISNGIKHSETGTGVIDVSVKDAGDHYVFSVADDGPGIDPEYHEQIFKMFQTLKSRDEVEGSGIGLAIVKKHVEYGGGEVTVKSAPGEGCEFRFTWPKPRTAREGGA